MAAINNPHQRILKALANFQCVEYEKLNTVYAINPEHSDKEKLENIWNHYFLPQAELLNDSISFETLTGRSFEQISPKNLDDYQWIFSFTLQQKLNALISDPSALKDLEEYTKAGNTNEEQIKWIHQNIPTTRKIVDLLNQREFFLSVKELQNKFSHSSTFAGQYQFFKENPNQASVWIKEAFQSEKHLSIRSSIVEFPVCWTEELKDITSFYLSHNNHFIHLDLLSFPKLFWCFISSNKNLQHFSCTSPSLKVVTVWNNNNLQHASFNLPSDTEIDENNAEEHLGISLSITENQSLQYLSLSSPSDKKIMGGYKSEYIFFNVEKNQSLSEISVNYPHKITLTVKNTSHLQDVKLNCPNLEYMSIEKHNMKTIDLSKCTSLDKQKFYSSHPEFNTLSIQVSFLFEKFRTFLSKQLTHYKSLSWTQLAKSTIWLGIRIALAIYAVKKIFEALHYIGLALLQTRSRSLS